ncbi:MAG: hypothetical protein JSS14_22375 [Proteobacteria bacterium]|nr:hypothetical protein [Pseudomonadota bacterium]
MGKDLALVCATALLCGCATQPATTPGTGSGAGYAPLVDMQGVDPDALATDVADCRSAASNVRVIRARERSDVEDVVVLGVGMVVPFGLVGIAVLSGLGIALTDDGRPRPADDALQQKTLVNCMARRGYRNLDPNVAVAYVPRPQAALEARPLAGGRDTYVAESYAKANFCQGPAKAQLESKGPGFERYSVVCGNGQRIVLRCEFGHCVPQALEVALGE